MEVKTQNKLIFDGVVFPNVHFDAIRRYDGSSNISVNVLPKVFYPKDEPQVFKIVMEVKLVSSDVFTLVLNAIGTFRFSAELDDPEFRKSFVNLNAPAIMFPYVRSFISTLTGNVGNGIINCLMIPTKFFSGDLEELPDEDIKS